LESKDPRDNKEGVEWLEAASRRGLTDAKFKLAQALEAGLGSSVNLEGARGWYENAALSGDTMAMKKIAEFLREGKGGNTDSVLAYAWADLYCTRLKGSVAASMFLPTLEKIKADLSPEELERGNKQCRKLDKIVPKEVRN
jgi:TPR repeat protein